MKKNKRGPFVPVAPPVEKEPILFASQWRGVGLGVLLVGLGFLALAKSDPAGQNLASYLAPILILGGYSVIGLSLWRR